MNNDYMTSEEINNVSIKEKAVRNHRWIGQNLYLLDDEGLDHWNRVNRLKVWNYHSAMDWLHGIRYLNDPLYRLNCIEQAINKKISSIEATQQLKASTQRVQQEETTIARNQYQNRDIWISDRHFR